MDYEKIVLQLLDRVKQLEARIEVLEEKQESDDLDLNLECNYFERDMIIDENRLMCQRSLSQVDQISNYISSIITQAIDDGIDHIIVKSSEVHRLLNLKNRMPSVCSAMRKVIEEDDRITNHKVIKDTPSHNSSTYTIRYEFK